MLIEDYLDWSRPAEVGIKTAKSEHGPRDFPERFSLPRRDSNRFQAVAASSFVNGLSISFLLVFRNLRYFEDAIQVHT